MTVEFVDTGLVKGASKAAKAFGNQFANIRTWRRHGPWVLFSRTTTWCTLLWGGLARLTIHRSDQHELRAGGPATAEKAIQVQQTCAGGAATRKRSA